LGHAGHVKVLPQQLSEVGGLAVDRDVGTVDHGQRLLAERADERCWCIVGRRWAWRP